MFEVITVVACIALVALLLWDDRATKARIAQSKEDNKKWQLDAEDLLKDARARRRAEELRAWIARREEMERQAEDRWPTRTAY